MRKAAEALGGEAELRRFLQVLSTDLFRWLRGQAPIPEEVFRKVVNLLADIETGAYPTAQRATTTAAQPRIR